MKTNNGKNMTNGRTYNGLFGASGAVRCRKIGTLFAIVFVVGKIVEAQAASSRWALGASVVQHNNGDRLTANASNDSERAEQKNQQYRIPWQEVQSEFQNLKI